MHFITFTMRDIIMKCKHNRILKKLALNIDHINTKEISGQYEEIYECSHCGMRMKVEEYVSK